MFRDLIDETYGSWEIREADVVLMGEWRDFLFGAKQSSMDRFYHRTCSKVSVMAEVGSVGFRHGFGEFYFGLRSVGARVGVREFLRKLVLVSEGVDRFWGGEEFVVRSVEDLRRLRKWTLGLCLLALGSTGVIGAMCFGDRSRECKAMMRACIEGVFMDLFKGESPEVLAGFLEHVFGLVGERGWGVVCSA